MYNPGKVAYFVACLKHQFEAFNFASLVLTDKPGRDPNNKD